MLSEVFGFLKELPVWVKFGVLFVAYFLARALLKALYRREAWKWRIQWAAWLAILIVVNYWWGVPGLLIAIAFGGGLVAWEILSQADRAEKRRRNRLQSAMRRSLYASYERHFGHLLHDPERKMGDWIGYDEFIKKNHGVSSDRELLDRFDEQGMTAEDFESMREEERAQAAVEKMERESAREKAKKA
jgi:hypothetical protein